MEEFGWRAEEKQLRRELAARVKWSSCLAIAICVAIKDGGELSEAAGCLSSIRLDRALRQRPHISQRTKETSHKYKKYVDIVLIGMTSQISKSVDQILERRTKIKRQNSIVSNINK